MKFVPAPYECEWGRERVAHAAERTCRPHRMVCGENVWRTQREKCLQRTFDSMLCTCACVYV